MEMSQIIALGLVVVALTVVMLSTRRRIARSRGSSGPGVRDRYAGYQKRQQVGRTLEEVMAELDELARQVNGRLDLRFSKLEAVIRDADDRIAQLARMVRAARGEAVVDITLPEAIPESGAAPVCRDPADNRSANDESARIRGDQAANETGPARADSQTSSSPHAEIYSLADRGRTHIEIASVVGRTTGEVELILALRKARIEAAAGNN